MSAMAETTRRLRPCDCPFRILDPKSEGEICPTCRGVLGPLSELDRRLLEYETKRRARDYEEQRQKWRGGGRR